MLQSFLYYVALFFEALVGVFGIRLYEEPRYAVIDRVVDRIEIRRYAPRLAAEIELSMAGEAGRNEAFRALFAYIAGANRRPAAAGDKIAMTAPVEIREAELIAMTAPVQTTEATGTVRMRFFLPARFTRETAPVPADARVKLVTVPVETVAALRYSGWGGDFAARQSELVGKIASTRWQLSGVPFVLVYDAPFTLPFLRRNEAAVAVTEP